MIRPNARDMMKMVGALAIAGALVSACGPNYPECSKDEHCASHGEVCVNKLCRQCRTDAQCQARSGNPCSVCAADNTCQKRTGCCTSDLDCPSGRCGGGDGTPGSGTCTESCEGVSCPAGQKCSRGICVTAAECSGDSDCPSGKRCSDGVCLSASCSFEPVLFDYNESALRLDQQAVLERNAACLKENSGSFRVEGNCDERGDAEYNLALGQRRAKSIIKNYTRLGVDPGRLDPISYGYERPVCEQHEESCWRRNRRVETVKR